MQSFSQTRGGQSASISFKDSILHPKASFGGLYTLTHFPKIPNLESLLHLDYTSLTQAIFSHLQLDCDSLDDALTSYKNFDNPLDPAPISHLHHHFYIQELYHGPSRAFKDMALQPLGKLFTHYANNEQYLLLTATSGDTGPATLESFKGIKNIKVVCIYPYQGTSDVQRLQMDTQDAKNLKVLPIIGNFDDAQQTLKNLLNQASFTQALEKKEFNLSASNSVNFGRIAFQIIYHIWGYLSLVRNQKIALGEEIYSVIPSGNFGNALGMFYAKLMGLPIRKIIIASNPNNILTDFIQKGIYDISHRKLLKTHSPAMDILKSSNVERVLFALFGSERTKSLMQNLDTHKRYSLNQQELSQLRQFFDAGFCTDEECLEQIRTLASKGKIIDPHTANAYAIATKLPKDSKSLICSTAEWSKFSPTIAYALTGKHFNDQQAITYIASQFHLTIPQSIANLFDRIKNSLNPIYPHQIEETIMAWLE